MAAINNITAFDGAATPVSHTFVPESVSRPTPTSVLATWRETGLTNVPVEAQPRLKMESWEEKTGTRVLRRTVEIPVMESVSGQNAAGYTAAPKVAYVVRDVRTLYAHKRSTTADRRLARQLGINIDSNVTTSVAAATSGFAPELFDLMINPT